MERVPAPFIDRIDISLSMLKVARSALRHQPVVPDRILHLINNWHEDLAGPHPFIVVFDDVSERRGQEESRLVAHWSQNTWAMMSEIHGRNLTGWLSFEIVDGAHAYLASHCLFGNQAWNDSLWKEPLPEESKNILQAWLGGPERQEGCRPLGKRKCVVYRLSDISRDVPLFLEYMWVQNARSRTWQRRIAIEIEHGDKAFAEFSDEDIALNP